MNIYEGLADKIEDRIRKGTLRPGEKLPSVRELSRREEVSPTTVVEAYELLKLRGAIEAKERSGFFVCYLPSPKLDSTKKNAAFIPLSKLDPDELIKALRMATYDPKIFPFGVASPLPEFYPTKALNRMVGRVLSEEPHLLSEYLFPPGSIRLRDQISQRYLRLGVKLPVESIVTTAGAIEAISLALRSTTRAGDLVALESPCYFGILQLVRSMGLKVIEIPIDPEVGLTALRFQEAIRKGKGQLKALITVSNFSNPLGSLVPEAAKKEIVAIAARADVVIIEDDIYGELYLEGRRPVPYKLFDKCDTVITCGSYAKTLCPALRVGYACSKKYAAQIAFHKAALSSGVSALGEEAIAAFIDTDVYEEHLRFLRRSYKTLLAQYSSSIIQCFPSGTKISQPKGGFVLWVQLPEHIDSRDVQRKALEQSISIAPGTIFSPSHREFSNFMRINCAIPWSAQSQKAISKLGKIICEQGDNNQK